MVKRILSPALFSLALIATSCSKDPVEAVLKNQNSIQVPVEPISEPESNAPIEPISEEEKTANWIVQMQESNGLLASSEYQDFVSLYDNALAAIWFTSQRKFAQTEKILDFFNGKIQSELLSNTGGFYQYRDSSGENASRTWMGDNAWLLIAINHYYEATANPKYNNMAGELENWLRSLQDEDGGLRGGINEDGSQIPKVTEGMITAFNAVKGYDDFHKKILDFIKENRWQSEEGLLLSWPENPDYANALDMHSLGFMIFEEFPYASLDKSDIFLNSQELTISGETISGFCFDIDKDVIWLEGTAQMAVAFHLGGYDTKAYDILAELEKAFISSTSLSDAKGLPYASNFGTSYGNSPLWDHADLTPALSSTIWYLFAKNNFNPFELGRVKDIPEADKFW